MVSALSSPLQDNRVIMGFCVAMVMEYIIYIRYLIQYIFTCIGLIRTHIYIYIYIYKYIMQIYAYMRRRKPLSASKP